MLTHGTPWLARPGSAITRVSQLVGSMRLALWCGAVCGQELIQSKRETLFESSVTDSTLRGRASRTPDLLTALLPVHPIDPFDVTTGAVKRAANILSVYIVEVKKFKWNSKVILSRDLLLNYLRRR